MNKICWAIEDVFDEMSFIPKQEFDYSILKSGVEYSSLVSKELLDFIVFSALTLHISASDQHTL